MACSHLTWGRWSVEVNLFAVLPEPRLIAAPHPENVHAVHLQPLDHRAGPLHLVQALPRRGGAGGAGAAPRRSGSSGPPLVLHRKVPGRSRVLREAPAQKQLVVSEGFLSVDDRSQRSCRERKTDSDHADHYMERFGKVGSNRTSITLYELQAVDELDFFGCIEVKVSEGGFSSDGETLQVIYGFNQPAEKGSIEKEKNVFK